MKKLLTFALMAALAFAGCTKYDDTGVKKDIDDLKGRVKTLEGAIEALNAQVEAGMLIKSVTPLPDGTGYRIEFTGGSSRAETSIDILHGEDGDDGTHGNHGVTPQIKVEANPDGSVSLWCKTDGDWELLLGNIKGTPGTTPGNGTDGDDGKDAVSAIVRVKDNGNGTVSVQYNNTFGYPDDKWVNAGAPIALDSNPRDKATIYSIIDDGTKITITMNNSDIATERTEFTFTKYVEAAPAPTRIEMMGFSSGVKIAEGESAEFRFVVNPHTATMQAGDTPQELTAWTLHQSGTRADYRNPSDDFELVSIVKDGIKQGQYIAEIRCVNNNTAIREYAMALVYEHTGGGLISSGTFTLGAAAAVGTATNRYVTTPYAGVDGKNHLLLYSVTDATHDRYIYYGGYIDFVPLLYQQAIYYGGTTPITVEYSKSTSTATVVTTGLQKAMGASFDFSASMESEVSVGGKINIFGIKAGAETHVKSSISTHLGSSVSTTDTYETSESKVEGETFSTSAMIGTKGEPAGMYRYALFSTTDVYYNVTVNRATGRVETTISLCARPTTYWGIDYDPQLGGSATFDKNDATPKLEVPEFTAESLPGAALEAPEIITQATNSYFYYTQPKFRIAGLVSPDVTYYYTIDGSTPTKSSSSVKNYSHSISGVPLQDWGIINLYYLNIYQLSGMTLDGKLASGNITLKVFASMPGVPDSPVSEKSFYIILRDY